MNLGIAIGVPFSNKKVKPPIITNGLVLWLDGKDFKNSPPSSILIDKSGLGNNGTPSNFAYTSLSGSDGGEAIVFDGVDDYISIANNANLQITNSITLEVVINKLNDNVADLLIKNGSYGIEIFPNASIATIEGIISPTRSKGNVNLPNGKIQMVMRYDSADGYVRLFVNGIQTSYSVLGKNPNGTLIASNTNVVSVGGPTFIEGFAHVNLYQARIYNRALTDAEILQNYQAM